MPSAAPPRLRALTTSRWTRLAIRLAAVAIVVIGAVYAFLAFVSIRTNVLWFRSVHTTGVYGTIVRAEILLFLVFGGLATLGVAASLAYVIRHRPPARPDPRRLWRARFRRFEPFLRRWLVVVVALYLGVRIGGRATHQWQTYVLWRHAQPWHQTDPQLHRDVSYYVAVLPFHQMVVGFLSSIVVTCLVVTIFAGYLYGAWRVRTRGHGPRIRPAFKRQVSVLLGLFLLLKAAAFWLNRYALTTSNRGPVTGMSYTDIHAALPAQTLLVVIAVLCAVLLFVNVRLNRLRYAAVGVVVLYAASYVVGGILPNLVYRFREAPSAASLDLTTIARNQSATLRAFGLDHHVVTKAYDNSPSAHTSATAATAQRTAQIRLLDPNQLTPTFNFKQEIEGYYKFKSTLDIDHYLVQGRQQDVAIAVRELNLKGISRGTWVNNHLVYTHGFGVVAAPTNTLNGTPDFINGGLPPKNQIPVSQPRIYFGQNSPSYSIVGEPAGSRKDIEFDYPSAGGQAQGATTYTGNGGVPIGSAFNRFLYAVKLHDPNIFFSSDINSASQLLTIRNPRARVATVAPWLTLDGDVYPAVVGGQVDWVVDGYTTSSNYPESQQVNLRSATTDSLTRNGATVAQPNTAVNYMQNSVKAVVNAYTGRVTLYEWNQANQPDPLLKSWESAFPGLVKPQSDIPSALLPHLRYPQDLFNVQRQLLAHYHVGSPGAFYNGSAFWKVPNDPTFSGFYGPNGSGPTMPSVYMSLAPSGRGGQVYSLSSPMVTLNYRSLAAFLSVNATPGPNYGTFTLLQMPDGAQLQSPSQIQSDIQSDSAIARALTLARGNSKVVLGNLLTIPLDGKVLFVEPIYLQAQGGSTFPILRHVVAVYGNGQPAFKPTLKAALAQAIANDAKAG